MKIPPLLEFFLNKVDWISFGCLLFLVPFGLLTLFSASPELARQQGLFALLGLVLYVILSAVNYRFWKKAAPHLYIAICLLLAITLLLGQVSRGTLRWLSWGPFNIQPAELAKFGLIVTLAAFLSSKYAFFSSLRTLFLSLLLVILPFILVILEPAVGSSFLLLIIWLGMILLSGVKIKHLGLLILPAFIGIPFVWLLLKDYQKERILSFLNPQGDPLGSGYNVIQSLIAVGSGRLFGRGFGRGTQSQLRFLPERHTDFIFASLAEEWGFIGASILLILFFILLWRIIAVAKNSPDDFGMLVCIGTFFLMLAQITVNVGMNLGILPVTGLPLPFISYGGSSLIVSFSLLGLVQSVALRETR